MRHLRPQIQALQRIQPVRALTIDREGMYAPPNGDYNGRMRYPTAIKSIENYVPKIEVVAAIEAFRSGRRNPPPKAAFISKAVECDIIEREEPYRPGKAGNQF